MNNQGYTTSTDDAKELDVFASAETAEESVKPAVGAGGQDLIIKRTKFSVYKNLFVLGFGWIFQFTAYQSISNLQSSLNSDDGLGTLSLSIIYVALILSCIFLPSIVIKRFKVKWTIIGSQLAYLLYIAANLYPRHYTLLPAAIVLGFGAATLWTAKCKMLTDMGTYYAGLLDEKPELHINRYFGIFFAMFQSSNIWGNIISSTVLKPVVDESNTVVNNISTCGYYDCPGSEGVKIKKPQLSTVYTLCGIYIGIAIAGVLLIFFFLDTYEKIGLNALTAKKAEKKPTELLISTVKHLRNKKQLLIVPLTLWSGFEQAFLGADFTKSFISCIKGVEYVGVIMICYGVSDAIGSYAFGYLVKFVGRVPCFVLAGLINYGVILFMIFWTPDDSQLYVLYLVAILWGLSDAVWQTQINAFYGVIFPAEEEAAFSNYRLWESLGFAIAYAYSNYLCIKVKLFLLLFYLTSGLLGYGTIEVMIMKKKNNQTDVSSSKF